MHINWRGSSPGEFSVIDPRGVISGVCTSTGGSSPEGYSLGAFLQGLMSGGILRVPGKTDIDGTQTYLSVFRRSTANFASVNDRPMCYRQQYTNLYADDSVMKRRYC